MNLNDLLLGKGIDPRHVLVFRHRPHEPELNKVLPWLAAEKPDVFNAYQQTQGKRVERAMQLMTHRNEIPVVAVLEDSALDAAMPKWDEIELTWEELGILPTRWKSALLQWRVIYYIFDTSDCKGYVGSAYGESNLLGRWLNYAARGHGGNSLLRQRDPRNFRFTILQLVAQNLDARDVIRLEGSWKQRLHTRVPYGLNDN